MNNGLQIIKIEEKIKVRIMLLVLFIVNVCWFSTYKFHSLMGDDLESWSIFNNYSHSFWHYVFLEDFADKYRPVFSIVQYSLFKLFGTEYILFYYVNVLFNFGIACMFFKVIKLITKETFFPFLFTLLYITARFSYYNVLQLTGIMEALGLLFLLMIIYYSILFYTKDNSKYLYWVFFYDFLIIFTHERYLVLTAFIILLIILKIGISIRSKFINSAITITLFFVNLLAKKIVFAAPILVGTGGAHIDFNPKQILSFGKSGLLNMFGLNMGPQYLSGIPFQASTSITKLISVLIAILVLLIISLYAKYIYKSDRSNRRNELGIILLFLALMGVLLLSASITIRQEFRWLYAPYAVFLIFIAYALNKSIKQKYFKYFVLIALLLCIVRNDNYYKIGIEDVFFVGNQITSDSMYDETIKKYGTNLSNYKLYIQKDDNVLDWLLYGKLYFKVYTNNPTYEFQYVKDSSEVPFGSTDNIIFLKLDPSSKKMISIVRK